MSTLATQPKTRKQEAREKQIDREQADAKRKADAKSPEEKAAEQAARKELREAETARKAQEKADAKAAREAAKAARPKDPKTENPELWATAKAEAHARIKELSRHLCACGCGRECRNTFAPGHDAQLASRLANERFAGLLAGK